MIRYLTLFTVLAAISLAMMAAVLAQYGYSLFDADMTMMAVVCVLVAAYVAWRISNVLKNRENNLQDRPAPGGAGQGKLSGLFQTRSKSLEARQAQLAARRRKLIEEGKLEPEEAPPSTPPPVADGEEKPTRVASSAPIKDKMAARAERVRRAREEGQI
ncbi:MAG: hypothetical protein Q8L84_03670 [Hyphomonas sp.]|nr:hypothetical protein [Hyphomonas sp.]